MDRLHEWKIGFACWLVLRLYDLQEASDKLLTASLHRSASWHKRLILSRSPEQVERMERARGLR